MVAPRLADFIRTTLLPAYAEIAASPRRQLDSAFHIYDDAIDDAIHAALVADLHRDRPHPLGPVLLIEDRDRARRPAPFGGRYVVAPMLRTEGAATYAAPVVMFQIDRELRVFTQRYANFAEIEIAKVTRAMIRNHVALSFAFYRSSQPPASTRSPS